MFKFELRPTPSKTMRALTPVLAVLATMHSGDLH